MIRTIATFVVGIVLTAVLGMQMILATRFGFKRVRCICDRNPRLWAQKILRTARVTVRVTGAERIDPDAPQILVSNHESWFDVFALVAHIPGRYRFVAKKELERIPIFGKAFTGCGNVTVDRGDRGSAIESLDRAARQINADDSTIVMFPEGTRSPDGRLQRFKKGAFVLAIQARVPIVPVAVVGSRQIMPKGAWSVHPGEIEIRIGEPIPVEDLGHGDRDALLERSYRAVAHLRGGTGAVRLEPAPGGASASPAG